MVCLHTNQDDLQPNDGVHSNRIPVTHDHTKYSVDRLYYECVPSADAIVGELSSYFVI